MADIKRIAFDRKLDKKYIIEFTLSGIDILHA
jgi:hypothetical protein